MMRETTTIITILLQACLVTAMFKDKTTNYDKRAIAWLVEKEKEYEEVYYSKERAQWNYFNDISNATMDAKVFEDIKMSEFMMVTGQEAFQEFDINLIQNKPAKAAMDWIQKERLALSGSEQTRMADLGSTLANPTTSESEMLNAFYDLAQLQNKAARAVGYSSYTDKLLYPYTKDYPDFRQKLDAMFYEILPFYEDIIAFGSSGRRGMVHIDNRNFSGVDTLKVAENFFVGLGFPKLRKNFFKGSMFQKPSDGRNVNCHPKVQEFGKGDYRMQMCSMKHFNTVHHELGHVYYLMAYENHTMWFRHGANPGFHEAIGDTIALSSNSDAYMKQLGILVEDDEKSETEKLGAALRQAWNAIGNMFSAYAIDVWRWDIYDGKVNKTDANDHWSFLAKKFMPESGMSKIWPIWHVKNSVGTVRYYVAGIYTYQFHDGLCSTIGLSDEDCTIAGSKVAGNRLWEMMKLGKSKPWPEAIRVVTGQGDISVKALLRYYGKLRKWLRAENKRNNVCLGWGVKYPAHVKLNGPRC